MAAVQSQGTGTLRLIARCILVAVLTGESLKGNRAQLAFIGPEERETDLGPDDLQTSVVAYAIGQRPRKIQIRR